MSTDRSITMAGEGEMNGSSKLHIFFFPLMAPGHFIPMIDMAKLFATKGVKSTLITTPYDQPSFLRSIERSQKLGLDIDLLTVTLPLQEVGLPEHCQNVQSITTSEMRGKFYIAMRMLDKQFRALIEEHRPDCVISDLFLPWTNDVAAEFGIPRLVFHGTNHFSMGATESVRLMKPHDNVASDSEPFLLPNFPGEITMTRGQLPDAFREEIYTKKIVIEVMESEIRSYGVVMNSFYELEPDYVNHYRDVLGRRTWNVGPLFICNQDKLQEESRVAVDRDDCLKWLDSKEPGSVVYVCFGSLTEISAAQLHEIALGLDSSGQHFVWVVKKDGSVEEGKEEWLPHGYEDRMCGKGLIIRGWAPQVLILKHPAIGGFVTHCGWNSTIESVCTGLPMVTWPVAGEQFFNEKLITQVLRIGVLMGVKQWKRWTMDSVESEKVEKAVRRLMVGEEAEGMRARARELSNMARKAVEEGGSSHSDLKALLEELKSSKVVPH